MKKAALYARVSTIDQNAEGQLIELRALAQHRGFAVHKEYVDHICGARPKRPALDQMLADIRRGEVEVVMVWAADRMARSVRHFLELLDELQHLNVEFVSLREQIDTGGPLGRAVMVIVGAVAELERNLIVERVKTGMRRAKLEGRRIGRKPLEVDHASVFRHHCHGQSLAQIAKAFNISRTSASRIIRAHKRKIAVPEGALQLRFQLPENNEAETAA